MLRKSAGCVGVFLASFGLMGQTAQTPTEIGRKALDLLLAEKYPELSAMFSDQMKQTVTLDFLKDRVSAEMQEFGKAQSIGEVVLGTDGPNNLVSFPVAFANASLHVQFTLNSSGQVAGMYFRPADKALPATWSRPAYSKADAFQTRDVTVGSDQWKLSGVLTVPAGKTKVPGIVLVHGPGPNDRDESISATRIFRDLAEGLASRGYAVLRYDKRTKAYGEEMSRTYYTLEQETVEDALRAVALLRDQPEIDGRSIFVLGHSLGGYASPRIAARDGKLAGVILFAAPARPIEDVSYEQTEYVARLNGEPAANIQARLNSMKGEVERVKKLAPSGDNPDILLGLPTAWWLNVKDYNPATEAKRLGIPILVLQGERDFQVTMKDFELWKSTLAGTANVTFHSYPALNDLFIEGQGKSSPAEYRNPGNVSPQVLDDISAWLARR
jgi:uncharacterized protein